jgi:hypothetical protein
MRRKLLVAGAALVGTVAMVAGPAAAHECTNISKPPGAGIQVIIGPDDELEWASQGVTVRVDHGLIDPSTGEGFRGLVGFDLDGNGTADASTYLVGPSGELPETAQLNGSPDHGVVNICTAIPSVCA